MPVRDVGALYKLALRCRSVAAGHGEETHAAAAVKIIWPRYQVLALAGPG
jgi:hypothetical protein